MNRAGQRLTRAGRISRREEFTAAFRQGRRFSDNVFQVRVAANNLQCARLGVSVPARVAPKAVGRNRIKRQVREVFRRQQNELDGFDVVVLAQPPADRADNAALRTALGQLLTQVAKKCKRS